MEEPDVRKIVAEAIGEYMRQDTARQEPAYKSELAEERKRREALEKRMNEMAEENKKARGAADEAERASAIREELQRLGVAKIDLAFKVVQGEIARTKDGNLMAGDRTMAEYLAAFAEENPELLPPRAEARTGKTDEQKTSAQRLKPLDLDNIGPHSSREDLERVREEIVRVSSKLT
jgi:ATP/maltotriose-dependent transcriptional regulator MalT